MEETEKSESSYQEDKIILQDSNATLFLFGSQHNSPEPLVQLDENLSVPTLQKLKVKENPHDENILKSSLSNPEVDQKDHLESNFPAENQTKKLEGRSENCSLKTNATKKKLPKTNLFEKEKQKAKKIKEIREKPDKLKSIMKLRPSNFEFTPKRISPDGYAERHRISHKLKHETMGTARKNRTEVEKEVHSIDKGRIESTSQFERHPENVFTEDEVREMMKLVLLSRDKVAEKTEIKIQGERGPSKGRSEASFPESHLCLGSEFCQNNGHDVGGVNPQVEGYCINNVKGELGNGEGEEIYGGLQRQYMDYHKHNLPPLQHEMFVESQRGEHGAGEMYAGECRGGTEAFCGYKRGVRKPVGKLRSLFASERQGRPLVDKHCSVMDHIKDAKKEDYMRRKEFLKNEQKRALNKSTPFSKPRHVDYSPYTVKDYQMLKFNSANRLGGLGPNVNNSEYVEKVSFSM